MFRKESHLMNHYSLYGDESYYEGIATYGIVGLPTRNIDNINKMIALIKKKYGVKDTAIFHSTEVFSKWKRRRAGFFSLKEEKDVFRFLFDLIIELKKLEVFYRLGHTSIIQPSFITNISSEKYSIQVKDNEKRLCSYAANAAICSMKNNMTSHKVTFFTEECPFMIKTGDKKEFAHDLYGANVLKANIVEKSPGVLEIADILAYTASHALIKSSRNHNEFCCLLWLLNPNSWIFQGIDAPLFHPEDKKVRSIGRMGAYPLNFKMKECKENISLIDIKHKDIPVQISLSNAYEKRHKKTKMKKQKKCKTSSSKKKLKTNIIKGNHITFVNLDKKIYHSDNFFIIDCINQGILEFSQDNINDAIRLFSQAIRIDPLNPAAYYNRALAYIKIKDYKKSIEDLNVTISLNPQNDFLSYDQRGLVYGYLNQHKESIDDYNKCININPQYDIAYCNRGISKMRLKDNEGAFEDFNKAIALNIKNEVAYTNRGSLKANLSYYNEALIDIDKAIKINPFYTPAYHEKGRVLIELNKYDAAVIILEKGKELEFKMNRY